MADIATLGLAIDSAPIDRAVASLDKFAPAAKRAETAATSLAQTINRATGVDAGFSRRAEDIAAYGTELDNLRAKFNPLFAAQQQYKANLAEINQAQRVGAISEKERAAAIETTKVNFVQQVNTLRGVNDALLTNTNLVKGASAAHAGLSGQAMALQHAMRSSVEQLALGVPVTQVLTQQLNHLSYAATGEGGISGAFKEVGTTIGAAVSWFGRFAISSAGVATGVVAAGAAVGILADKYHTAQLEIQRSLMGIGAASGATVADINRFAEASTSAFGLSVSQGREAASAFAATGRIYGENVGLATKAVSNFAIVTGTDAVEATKALTKAFADPKAGADQLNAVLGNLDGRTREYIATLVETGQRQEAQRVLIQATIDATKNATEVLGPFEKAWRAVANAASAAADATAKAAGAGRATAGQARIDDILRELEQRGRAPGMLGMKANEEAIASLRAELARLQDQIAATARAAGDARLRQISTDADDAVKAIIPQIDQIGKLKEAYEKLRLAQSTPGAAGRMGLAGDVQAANNAYEVQIRQIQEAKDQTARYNEESLKLVGSWRGVLEAVTKVGEASKNLKAPGEGFAGSSLAQSPTVMYGGPQRSIQIERQLAGLRDQAAVAGSINESERIGNQQMATYNALIRQGVYHLDAQAVALAEANVAQAALSAQQARQYKQQADNLQGLKDQYAISVATTEQERIQATYEARKAELRRQENPLGDEIAMQERLNALGRLNAQESMQRQAEHDRELEESARKSEEADQKRIQNMNKTQEQWDAYIQQIENAKQAVLELAYQEHFLTPGGSAEFAVGGRSQFRQGGYTSTAPGAEKVLSMGLNQFGPGGFSPDFSPFAQMLNVPNQQGLTYLVDQLLASGKSITDAINQIIKIGPLNDTNAQFLQQLTELLPDADKQAAIERELENLRRQPITLAREMLIKQLNESLKQLTDATNANTATLDPLFTGGHSALRIGYYNEGGSAGSKYYQDTSGLPTAQGGPIGITPGISIPPSNYLHAATGFSGIVPGSGSGDIVPFRAMLTPGERVTVTPRGSNDNGAGVTNVFQTINFPASALGETRRSARQMAEGFRRSVI